MTANTTRVNAFNSIFREMRKRETADLYRRISSLLRAIGNAEDDAMQDFQNPTTQNLVDAWILLGDASLILEELAEYGLPGHERGRRRHE